MVLCPHHDAGDRASIRVCADTCGLLLRWKCSQQTLPKPDCTKVKTAEKSSKSAHREHVSLDNWGPHKCSAMRQYESPLSP